MQEATKNRPAIAELLKNFLEMLAIVASVRAAMLLPLDIWDEMLKNLMRLRLKSSTVFSDTLGRIIVWEPPSAGLSNVQFFQFATRKEALGAPEEGLAAIGFWLATGLVLIVFVLVQQILQRITVNELASPNLLYVPAIFNSAS